MARKYITVTLTARVSGDSVVLLDAHGKKIAVIPALSAECTTIGTIKAIEVRHEWRHAFMKMIAYNGHRHTSSRHDKWHRKTQSWLASLRHRRNRPEECRKSHERRANRWIEKRPNWDEAFTLMLKRNDCVFHRHRHRAKNPWRVWAETVAANIKSRRRRHEDDYEAIQANAVRSSEQTGGTGVQVRFDWTSFDTADSLA
jgi:hypothetical protein